MILLRLFCGIDQLWFERSENPNPYFLGQKAVKLIEAFEQKV